MKFLLKIFTPQRIYFDGEIESLTCSTAQGELTILADHADFIANVEICKLTLKSMGNTSIFALGGGAINFFHKENRVYLIVNSIDATDEIDIKRALADKEVAEKLKESASNETELRNAEYKLQNALNKINIYNGK